MKRQDLYVVRSISYESTRGHAGKEEPGLEIRGKVTNSREK